MSAALDGRDATAQLGQVVAPSGDGVTPYTPNQQTMGVVGEVLDQTDAATDSHGVAAVSRAEARRMRKEQRKEERRELMRNQRREKKRAKQQRKQEARRELLEAMAPDERAAFLEKQKAEGLARKVEDQASLQYAFDSGKPRVVINCSFSNTNYKEHTSLAKQAQMAYTAVRDLRSPIQLHLTSVNAENASLRALEAIGMRGWLIHVHDKPVWDLFDINQLVILSPDAQEDLEDVQEDLVYVIGGIVDRSVTKLQSLEQAQQHGAICLRRLPIKKHGPRGAHPVLNIDTVVRILAECLRRGNDWQGILEDCLPYRHSGQPTARMLRKRRARVRLEQTGRDGGAEESEDGSSGTASELEESCIEGGLASSSAPSAHAELPNVLGSQKSVIGSAMLAGNAT